MVAGWAKGGGPVVFPAVAGVRTGSGGARYLVLELHLDNRARATGKTIKSGVRLHLASTLREHDVGTLVLVRSSSPIIFSLLHQLYFLQAI